MRKIIIYYLMVSFLSLSVVRPASAALPALAAAGLGSFASSSGVSRAAVAAYAYIERGRVAAAVKGLGIFAGINLVAVGLMDSYFTEDGSPLPATQIADQIRYTNDRYPGSVFVTDNPVYLVVQQTECYAYFNTGNGNRGFYFPRGYALADKPFGSDIDYLFSETGYFCPAEDVFVDFSLADLLFGSITDTSPPVLQGGDFSGTPVVVYSPDSANMSLSDDGLPPIVWDDVFWESLSSDSKGDYAGMTSGEALAAANGVSGLSNDSLSDYDVLPSLTGSGLDSTIIEGTETTDNGDGTETTTETTIDLSPLVNFFRTAINAQTGALTANADSNADSIKSRISSQTAILDAAISDQTTQLGEKLDEIKTSLTATPEQLNQLTSPPVFSETFLSDSANAQDFALSEQISTTTDSIVFDGLDDSLVSVSGSSSRSITFEVLGTTYTIDLQPFFILASVVSVFVYIGSSLLGYRIVARAFS